MTARGASLVLLWRFLLATRVDELAAPLEQDLGRGSVRD